MRDVARVESVWSDAEEGAEDSYQVTWVLKRKPEGWRIAGLETPITPGQSPVFFNFENGAEMHQTLAQAEAQLTQQMAEEEEVRQATANAYGQEGDLRR